MKGVNKKWSDFSGGNRHATIIGQIHRNLVVLVIGTVIVGGLIFAGLYRSGLLGPIRGGNSNGLTLIWKVSDHNASRGLLQNSLTAQDVPNYSDEPVITLERNNDGSLKALPRYQGTLEYHAP